MSCEYTKGLDGLGPVMTMVYGLITDNRRSLFLRVQMCDSRNIFNVDISQENIPIIVMEGKDQKNRESKV